MKIAKKVAALAVALVIPVGFTLLGGTAANAATEDCRTVVSTLTNHPDSGNHGTWALDDFTRTVKVCHVPDVLETAPSIAEKAVEVQSWNYHVVVADEGTFTTVGGAYNSPNDGHAVLPNIPGAMKGGFTADVQAPADWQFFTPNVLDGKTFTGAPGTQAGGPTTSTWVKALWSDGLGKESSFINRDWAWVYKTCNQYWIDSLKTNDGTSHLAGDITGYSRIACPRVVFENVCGGFTNVIVFNDAPWVKAVLKFKLSTDNIVRELVGQEEWTTTVNTTDLIKVSTASGTKLGEHTWSQPENCSTPTPSASPTTAPPTTTGPPAAPLPVTGADASSALLYGGVGVAGGVIMLIGAGIYWLRRRRDQETVA